jgi:hypothetical protein
MLAERLLKTASNKAALVDRLLTSEPNKNAFANLYFRNTHLMVLRLIPPTENCHGTTLTKRIIKENEFIHEAPHGPHVSLLTDSPTLIQMDHFRRAV